MQPRKRRSGEENSKLNVPDFFLFSRLIPWSFARNSLVDIPLALDPRAGLVSMQITQLRDSNTGQITPFRPRTVNLFFRLFLARFYDLHGKPAPSAPRPSLFIERREGGVRVFGQFGELIVIQEKFYGVKWSLIVSARCIFKLSRSNRSIRRRFNLLLSFHFYSNI